MPQKSKKEQSSEDHHSRWHSFHFSGKVIMCSVLFGFLLVLVGGIVMAIGMDEDEDKKPDVFNEVQTKAPMSFIGPVVMGIGGFIVVLGVTMCLFETMCRKRDSDSSPLIGDHGNRKDSSIKGDSYDPSMPSTSQYYDEIQRSHDKKSSRAKAVSRKSKDGRNKNYSESSESPSSSQSSIPISINAKNFMHTSDNFVTPSSSFVTGTTLMNINRRDAENQNSTSLMKSYNSSGTWNVSTEFQTPSTSFRDEISEEEMKDNLQSLSEGLDKAVSKKLKNLKHDFVTPQSSNTENMALKENDMLAAGNIPNPTEVSNKHQFVTPKNSDSETLADYDATKEKENRIIVEEASLNSATKTNSDEIHRKFSDSHNKTQKTNLVDINEVTEIDVHESDANDEVTESDELKKTATVKSSPSVNNITQYLHSNDDKIPTPLNLEGNLETHTEEETFTDQNLLNTTQILDTPIESPNEIEHVSSEDIL